MATTSQSSIRKLPLLPVREDVFSLKSRIQDLEKEVSSYKLRLDELRKAKNNLIIKKTTEYVKAGVPALGHRDRLFNTSPDEVKFLPPLVDVLPRPSRDDSSQSSLNPSAITFIQQQEQEPELNMENYNELQRVVENLNGELTEAKNLIAALRIENEEAKDLLEKAKREHQIELAEALSKHEESKKEIKQWELMYKEWMKMMEERVTNINRTHQVLQQCIAQTNPDSSESQ